MREHWANCITHFDGGVADFVSSYFSETQRRCLLVAAAGFDPRSRHIAQMLSSVLSDRLYALFIREERGRPQEHLVSEADSNEVALRSIVPNSSVEHVDIFGEDGAAIGGSRIATLLARIPIDEAITDVVLDMSALSIGIGFPAAKMLLADCEARGNCAFHILIASNPELDDHITSEPSDRPMPVKGFSGVAQFASTLDPARIWLPQLAKGRRVALTRIGLSVGECYKICPVLPFPARDPRRADALLSEYENELVNEWQVDPRDIVYVSEQNPLDCYRTLSTLKLRYDRTVEGTFEPHMILSPIGSKVMAAGALMAAIEHDLTVHYVETVRYEWEREASETTGSPDTMVHLLLCGPAYGDYADVTKVPEE